MMGVLFLEHLRSKQGLLKSAQLVLLIIAYACVRSTWYISIDAYGFYEAVTLGYSVAIVLFMLFTVFGAPSKIQFVNWKMVEFMMDTMGFIFVATGSIIAAVKSYEVPVLVAASICGLLTSYLIVGSVILSYVANRHSPSEDRPV